MLELAIWLYHIGTPDLAVRIATDVATALFLLWGILNHYAKKEAEEAFLEVSKEAALLEDGGESQTGYVG